MYVVLENLSKGQPSNMDLHIPPNTDMAKVELFRTQGTCNPSDWTSGEVFLNWMHFFVEQVRPTADKNYQVDVNIEDGPCTPKGFETTKETQGNCVSAASPEPECSKTYYSPLILRPIPQPAKPITRKWQLQRSTMLTSIPVQKEQKQKFEKAVKTAMKPLDDISTKASQKTVKKTAKEKKKKKIKTDDVSCIFCGEIYILEDDQPTEN